MRGGWVERGTVMIRLSRPHFAFYRGYLDGLELGSLARRYLETVIGLENAADDLRVAKSSVKWIRDQLMIAARRSPRPSHARLFDLPPEKLNVQYARAVPSLEDFREERDPYEVYSEEDLIALFQDEYGSGSSKPDRRIERNARLRTKQMYALFQLEEQVAADPHLSDGVDGWLDPAIARRLQDAGVHTLGQLIEGMNGFGYRWYTKIPKIGAKAAAQIAKWLTEPSVTASLGVGLNTRALTPRRDLPPALLSPPPPRTAIVPLERFLAPAALDGSQGLNRGDRALLSARNDMEAINAWLKTRKPGGHSVRSYRKEAERFLLWAIMEKGKPISSLSVEDCTDYRDFLWALGRTPPAEWALRHQIPQTAWVGKRGTERWSEYWRPFSGKLVESSQKTALVILQTLCQWLTDQHYLHGNPWKGIDALAKRSYKIDTSHALTVAEWQSVKEYLATLPPDDRYYRLRFILVLAYSTGLRLSELVSLRKGALRPFARSGETGEYWQIVVVGKGGVDREVELNQVVMAELRHYFSRRGHPSFESVPMEAPLIAALPSPGDTGTADDPLTVFRVYRILKRFFAKVANALPGADAGKAAHIRLASTHWLRHTFATHALQNGVSLEVVRGLLGHKSLDTTSVYITAERDRRSREMEIFGNTSIL
jgi:site-specific recombinase XerD